VLSLAGMCKHSHIVAQRMVENVRRTLCLTGDGLAACLAPPAHPSTHDDDTVLIGWWTLWQERLHAYRALAPALAPARAVLDSLQAVREEGLQEWRWQEMRAYLQERARCGAVAAAAAADVPVPKTSKCQ
jgi:hypothetical protein